MKFKPGQLFIVATPIGNLEDITQRALKTLACVPLIAAEDTRHSKKLLHHFKINTPIVSLHAYNEKDRIQNLLSHLSSGLDLALISDAGTPLISDPGQKLVAQVHALGFKVVPIPGPCALIAALSVSGMPASRFLFEGFLPLKGSARIERLQALKTETRTCVFYEAPHRLLKLLKEMFEVLGDRPILFGRELTKQFETVYVGKLSDIRQWVLEDENQQKGELVIVLSGQETVLKSELKPSSLEVLKILLEALPLKQAVKVAARLTRESKNQLYQWAIENS